MPTIENPQAWLPQAKQVSIETDQSLRASTIRGDLRRKQLANSVSSDSTETFTSCRDSLARQRRRKAVETWRALRKRNVPSADVASKRQLLFLVLFLGAFLRVSAFHQPLLYLFPLGFLLSLPVLHEHACYVGQQRGRILWYKGYASGKSRIEHRGKAAYAEGSLMTPLQKLHNTDARPCDPFPFTTPPAQAGQGSIEACS